MKLLSTTNILRALEAAARLHRHPSGVELQYPDGSRVTIPEGIFFRLLGQEKIEQDNKAQGGFYRLKQ